MGKAATAGGALVATGVLVLAWSSQALAQEKPQEPVAKPAELRVVRDVVAVGVADREPVQPGQAFVPEVGRVFYFTEVRAEAPPAELVHVWYYQDREVARVPLAIQGSPWRTWSSKQILPESIGPWKVEAVTPDGAVAASKAFAVQPSAPAPVAPPEKTEEGKAPGTQ